MEALGSRGLHVRSSIQWTLDFLATLQREMNKKTATVLFVVLPFPSIKEDQGESMRETEIYIFAKRYIYIYVYIRLSCSIRTRPIIFPFHRRGCTFHAGAVTLQLFKLRWRNAYRCRTLVSGTRKLAAAPSFLNIRGISFVCRGSWLLVNSYPGFHRILFVRKLIRRALIRRIAASSIINTSACAEFNLLRMSRIFCPKMVIFSQF